MTDEPHLEWWPGRWLARRLFNGLELAVTISFAS